MEVIVKQALCKGCGVCVSACPYKAISMRDGVAVIDQLKCTACQICIDVCPTGAFQLLETKEPILTAASRSIEVVEPETIVVTPPDNYGKGAMILSLLGQYLIPRVADVLAAYLERRVSSPVQVQNSNTRQISANYPHRRRRQRRGTANSSITYERR